MVHKPHQRDQLDSATAVHVSFLQGLHSFLEYHGFLAIAINGDHDA